MNLLSVMKEIAARASHMPILDGRSFWAPYATIDPPMFLVTLPDETDPNFTYARGVKTFEMIGWLPVSISDPEGAVGALCQFYSDDDPANSIMHTLQGNDYASCDHVQITRIRFLPVLLGGVRYLAARNDLLVTGKGK